MLKAAFEIGFLESSDCVKCAEDLSEDEKENLPDSDFCLPEERKYPIPDKSHAEAAIRLCGRDSDVSCEKIKRCVQQKYPDVGKEDEEE